MSPPFVAWLAWPIAWADPHVALFFWTLVSTLSIAASGWLLRERWPALLIAAVPFWYGLVLGQVGGLALLLVVLCLQLIQTRPQVAGLALAVAFQVKPNLVLIIPLFLLLSRAWPALATFAAASLAFLALYVLMLGLGFPSRYLSLLHSVSPEALANPLAPLVLPALIVAWRKRDVRWAVGAGVLFSLTVLSYQHPQDQAMLVVPFVALTPAVGRVTALCRGAAMSALIFVCTIGIYLAPAFALIALLWRVSPAQLMEVSGPVLGPAASPAGSTTLSPRSAPG